MAAAAAAAAGQPPQLLDLPEDVLLRIALQLSLQGQLLLAGVCRKLRQMCAGPSELWRVVKATLRAEEGADAALQQLVRFRRWLRPRLPAVEHLQLSMWTPLTHTAPVALLDELLAGSGAGLPHQPPLPLARLTIPWLGAVDFHLSTLAHLPALRSVAFYDTRLRVFGGPLAPGEQAAQQGGPLPSQPPLTDFTVDGGQLHFDVQVQGGWLPLSVTALRLTECQLRDLPRGLLSSLTNLRSLKLHRNELGLASLSASLQHCTALQMLNLSCCQLRRFPSAVSALTRLKILYLHNAFSPNYMPPEAAWDALRPLTALRFLAVSGNSLPALPPAVVQMSHLLALHCEQNSFAALPPGPYLCSLRELLLGWHMALASPAALQAATRLTRLVLWRTSLQDGPMDPSLDLPAVAGEPLVNALAAMPALRRVDDSMKHPGAYLLWPAVAQVMWRVGQRCPHLQLGVLQRKSIGWGMSRLRQAEQEEAEEEQRRQQAQQGAQELEQGQADAGC
ncbi:small GTP-binding [Chlorella sorokiniana]|uniref:Small GTP-binding n=1 Tax=Chlorella sorokiniana TaxID=3076 RepID=A0A2P6TGC5_CHLSO|nr:small GTP-binding [Chlorella sorokiniana]|eukprot:PRW33171.1 small GTP-binding [Chlorella sorokiniana]